MGTGDFMPNVLWFMEASTVLPLYHKLCFHCIASCAPTGSPAVPYQGCTHRANRVNAEVVEEMSAIVLPRKVLNDAVQFSSHPKSLPDRMR